MTAGPVGCLWPGSGGQHDGVGRLGAQGGGRGLRAGSDLDAVTLAFGGQVAHHVEELGAGRHRRGRGDLAAGPQLAFLQRDPVAALGRRGRGLEAGRATADHDHPQAPPTGRRQRDGLPAGARVLDAAHPPVQAHPPDALLVAGQAGADLGGKPRAGLGDEIRVGDLPPHHAHQVAVTVGQRPLGLDRVLDPAHPDHGQPDRLPDCAGDEQGVPGRDAHGRLDHEQRGRGHPDGGVDVVDLAGRLHHPGHLDGLLQRAAALDQLIAADPHAQRTLRPDRVAHGIDDFQQDPRPGRQRPAVGVGALVRRGR